MNFFSWIETGCKVAQDVDIAKHNKRYHPNGITGETYCKYIGREGEGEVASGVRGRGQDYSRYYQDSSYGTKFVEIRTWLEKNLGGRTVLVDVNDKDRCKADKLWGRIEPHFADWGNPPTEKEFENGCRVVFGVCADLRRRFPGIPLDIDRVVPFNFTRHKVACSSLDKRQGMSYIGIMASREHLESLVPGEGEKSERLHWDVCRHEIGHSLATEEVLEVAEKALTIEEQSRGQQCILEDLYYRVSSYAASVKAEEIIGAMPRDAKHHLSVIDEIIAEVFSKYTAPEYQEGSMPNYLESIAEEMMKTRTQRDADRVVADSHDASVVDVEKRQSTPEENEFILGCSPRYIGGETEYGYWDKFNDRWKAVAANSPYENIMRALKRGTLSESDLHFRK